MGTILIDSLKYTLFKYKKATDEIDELITHFSPK